MRPRLVLSFLALLACSAALARAGTDYCFEYKGLEFQQTVYLTINGNKIEGTFESGGYAVATSSETFEFTGTRAGRRLTIKFPDTPLPPELPTGTTTMVWKLSKEVLEIPMFGKTGETTHASAYTAKFKRCKDN
jgi:hypothetical protein